MRSRGIIEPNVITHATVPKTSLSVMAFAMPPLSPYASIAFVAAVTSYEILPITVSLIHGNTYPKPAARVSTVATIPIAGATVNNPDDTIVLFIVDFSMPSCLALFIARTKKNTA